jgi:hypothetical protein
MKKFMLLTVASISILGSVSASAAEEQLCSTQYLDISADGKTVSLNERGANQFELTKTKKGLSFNPKFLTSEAARKFFNQDTLERVELDEQGRAKKVLLKSDVMASAEPVFTIYDLDYKNGRCFVKNKTADRQFRANTQMCRSLADILKENQQCNEKADGQIRALFKKYGDALKDETVNPKLSYGPAADAGRVIGNCEQDPYLRRSFSDQSLWASAGSAAGAAAAK